MISNRSGRTPRLKALVAVVLASIAGSAAGSVEKPAAPQPMVVAMMDDMGRPMNNMGAGSAGGNAGAAGNPSGMGGMGPGQGGGTGGMGMGMGMGGMGMDMGGGMAPGGAMQPPQMRPPMNRGRGMDMMGSMRGGAQMPGMASMPPLSNLPGFPGASHLYHVGATGFFLDHPQHIQLSGEQQAALNRIKERSTLDQRTAERRIEEAEQELWTLTAAESPEIAKIEDKVRSIERLRGDQRLAFIRSVGEAARVLTPEQRAVLLGVKPRPPQASSGR